MGRRAMVTGTGGLSRLAAAQSRSISPENRTGEKGRAAADADGVAAAAARDLGQGWKISPYVHVAPGSVLDAAYFHAQFRRSNPLGYQSVHPILTASGHGHYVGTYLAWGSNSNGWWGEGEVKFYLFIPDGRDARLTQSRFGMYRWHLADPVRFASDIRVTVQALGWRSGGRYLPLRDDIASVAYWYQTLPTAPFPVLPGADELEII